MPTLLLMAAGMGSRFGGLKQVEPLGPGGESLVDYAVFDARRAGFERIVFIVRRDIEQDFKDTVLKRLAAGGVEAEYVFQDADDLPAPGVPQGGLQHRKKPWGTAHAVWSARRLVDEPFAVLNADDYYGPQAYRLLAEHLQKRPGEYAIVGYRLAETLSAHGTVARAILEQDADKRLVRLRERTQLARQPDGRIVDGDPTLAGLGAEEVSAQAEVSMNIMGLTPAVFEQLGSALSAFIQESGREPKSELYLPDVIGQLVSRGEASVRVLPTEEEWFGVTYAADSDAVRARLRDFVREGRYPERLWA